jgi:hypothetical protein
VRGPSSHVFQLTQKATLFHHDSDFCVRTLFHRDSGCYQTSNVDCSFVLVILVSSWSFRDGAYGARATTVVGNNSGLSLFSFVVGVEQLSVLASWGA